MVDSMNISSTIYVAGHMGLVGRALIRALQKGGYTNVITRSFDELDLRNQAAVEKFFYQHRPEYVFLAAAKVGGILANMRSPAEFIHDNLAIQTNVIDAAYRYGVKKLLFLGSSCIYPRDCPQPIQENFLMTGSLEVTNDAYAIAKIAGIKMCQAYNKQYGTTFISCMPTNLYGPHDNFNAETSHVLPALIAKSVYAKNNREPHITVWGTGEPRREFLYVDDLADACLFLMHHYADSAIINIGTGIDVTIKELAFVVQQALGYAGDIVFDASKPDGTPRKVLDVERINNLGWRASISLRDGIERTIAWYLLNQS
jgi:GDP-L-fucose synthase